MNRYIKAMEIGLANEERGISYINLIDKLQKDLGYKLSYSAELTFMEWFISNFTSDTVNIDYHNNINKLRDYQSKRDGAKINPPKSLNADLMLQKLSIRHFLSGQASKQYLDYLELKESRLAATQARKQSNYSIGIAIAAIVLSGVLGIASLMYQTDNVKPPFDVKAIEDLTGKDKLFEENKELKEKLYKAELMISLYESDKGNNNTSTKD